MNFLKRLQETAGDVGFYYCPLGGEAVEYNADLPLVAASVIKIPIMVEAFRRFGEGTLDPNEEVTVPPEAKKPSCGALTYMHDGLRVSVLDLVTLMIILSDNTATNLMIDRLGIDQINATMVSLGIPGIALRRKLFDAEKSRQGIQNTITARGIGILLHKMAQGKLLGEAADAQMIGILKNQRLNGKLPFFIDDVDIAHKTGEDSGTTHDVGVIYTAQPFVVCMLSNNVNVPQFERLMQDAALELYRMNNRMVYFVRHGQTDWNVEGRLQGCTDIPLNATGVAQAEELGEALAASGKKIDRVYTSELGRANRTGQIVADRLGIPCEARPNLYERGFGDWEGYLQPEIQERWPQLYADWKSQVSNFKPPKGESYDEMSERMVKAVRGILEETDENVLIVSHGGSLSAFLRKVSDAGDGKPAQRNFLNNGEIVELPVQKILDKVGK